MRRMATLVAVLVVLGGGFSAPIAQDAVLPPELGRGRCAGRAFEPPTFLTIVGEIVRIDPAPPCRRCRGGGVLMLRADPASEPVAVRLRFDPNTLATTFALGEFVTVAGWRVVLRSGPALIPSHLWRADGTLVRADDWRLGGGCPRCAHGCRRW